ncbi:Outer membrane usher protein YehB [Mixta theicola]|nr:fimbria/pilus outer membrane usher protein [Mixta theicola]QHM74233.1 Outer membrane usher protein YehB [Mixta theicola]
MNTNKKEMVVRYVCSLPMVVCFITATPALAESFNSSFLLGEAANNSWNDVKKVISPGIYDFDLFINNKWQGKYRIKVDAQEIIYIDAESAGQLALSDIREIINNKKGWIPVEFFLHGGTSQLSPAQMRLELAIPQAWVLSQDNRWITAGQWDKGINGLYANYNFNYYHTWHKGDMQNADNLYLSLRSGFNLGAWHMKDRSTYQKSRNGSGRWKTSERYLERALPDFHATLKLGDTFSESLWFDSVKFRGVALKKENRMYPDIYSTYMPVIRGTAASNSVVRVYQDGNTLSEITIPAGPYAIRDLMPTGSRSDLKVELEEASGRRESFIVPYSTVPDMLRAGSSDWQLSAGEMQLDGSSYQPNYIQAGYAYGLNNYFTLFGGANISQKYRSFLAGTAISAPWFGSISFNTERSDAQLFNQRTYSGNRYKIAWSRYLPTRTNISLATYYYSTENYLSLYDHVMLNNLLQHQQSASRYLRNKSTLSFTIDQPLPEGWGRITLNGYWQRYWRSPERTRQYRLSWSDTLYGISYGLAASRTQYEYGRNQSANAFDELFYGSRRNNENRIELTISIPVTLFNGYGSVNTSMVASNNRLSGYSAGVNGSNQVFDYSLNLTGDRERGYHSVNTFDTWHSDYSTLTANYTESEHYRQLGAGASGALLAWKGGVLASNKTGNTFVILEAPGLKNARVNSDPTLKTNAKGRILIPSAAAWRINTFRLEGEEKESGGAELINNIARTAPWDGSISYVKYKTDRRKTYTYRARLPQNRPLPFGADVINRDGKVIGYVAQDSLIYLKADKAPETFSVVLSASDPAAICTVNMPDAAAANLCQPAMEQRGEIK